MNIDWQDLVALAAVLIAAAYLVRRGWLFIVKRRTGGCASGACSTCPSSTPAGGSGTGSTATSNSAAGRAAQPQAFIPLDQLTAFKSRAAHREHPAK